MSTGLMADKQPAAGNLSLTQLVSKDHKLYHLFNFIGKNYGDNPENILKAVGSIFDFDKGFRTLLSSDKKFTFKNAVNILRYTLPASLYSVEMGIKIRKYIKNIHNEDLSEYDKKVVKVKKLIGVKDSLSDWNVSSVLHEEIIHWLLGSPKTDGFKIIGYYSDPEIEKIEKMPEKFTSVWMLFEFRGKKLILKCETGGYGDITILKNVLFWLDYTTITEKDIHDLNMLIIKNFIFAFNVGKNVLELKGGGIITEKRAVVNENINQFDINPLVLEIRKVLANGRKRGYAFIGKQGTGKSIIMRKLEEILTDLVIIRISPDEFSSSGGIKRSFDLIRTIQPVVVVIEDLDAFRFKDKNERVGTFINEIDDNNNLNAVFLVTINDTDMVHRTIIDRPGRFDEIYEIKPPQTELEAYEVMKSKYNKLVDSYTSFKGVKFPEINEFNHGILGECIKNKFTQAELTSGIIEKIFLNVDNPKDMCFNDAVKNAIDSFEISKKSLKTYKFNEESEDADDESVACTETPQAIAKI